MSLVIERGFMVLVAEIKKQANARLSFDKIQNPDTYKLKGLNFSVGQMTTLNATMEKTVL